MTISEVVQLAAERPLTKEEVDVARTQLKLTIPEFYNAVSRRIHMGYTAGEYTWQLGDSAMNNLWIFALEDDPLEFPAYSAEVFDAFDAGEYYQIFWEGDPDDYDPGFWTKRRLADAERFYKTFSIPIGMKRVLRRLTRWVGARFRSEASLPPSVVPKDETLRQDRRFWKALEDDPSREVCRSKGCTEVRVTYGIYCKRHHFEMVNKRPYKGNLT